MSKFLPFFLVTFIFAEDPPDKKLLEKCMHPSITISGESSYGTGTIIKSIKMEDKEYLNFFISCGHIIAPKDDYTVTIYKYKNYSFVSSTEDIPCLFYSYDLKRDVSIGGFLSKEKMPCADTDLDPQLHVGTRLSVFGSGLNDYPRLEEGKVTAPAVKKMFNYKVIRANFHCVPGDSGAAVYKDYKVIGIVNSIRHTRHSPVFNTSFFVPLNVFKEWSENNNNAFDFCWNNSPIPSLFYKKLKFMKDYVRE